MEAALGKRHADEGVGGDDQDDDLGDAGDVVVDEAAAVEVGEVGVDAAVEGGD